MRRILKGCQLETTLGNNRAAFVLVGGRRFVCLARSIAADTHEVTFWAHEGTIIGGEGRQLPLTLSTEEFMRRWSLHILPKGYTKTRRWGGWSNTRAARYY
jgi:hypothetical protein